MCYFFVSFFVFRPKTCFYFVFRFRPQKECAFSAYIIISVEKQKPVFGKPLVASDQVNGAYAHFHKCKMLTRSQDCSTWLWRLRCRKDRHIQFPNDLRSRLPVVLRMKTNHPLDELSANTAIGTAAQVWWAAVNARRRQIQNEMCFLGFHPGCPTASYIIRWISKTF